MNAAETLNKLQQLFNGHKTTVQNETETLDAATRLMKKWDASSLNNAVYCEAKSRAILDLNAVFPL